jgi:uncharacterized protein (DUF1778 family)
MAMLKAKERISARVPQHAYQKLTQAAEISGATLNQFLLQAALEKAQMIIEKNRTIKLSTQSATVFFDAIENPPKPKSKLKKAMKIYKESILRTIRLHPLA